jgi:hypothetical protein
MERAEIRERVIPTLKLKVKELYGYTRRGSDDGL